MQKNAKTNINKVKNAKSMLKNNQKQEKYFYSSDEDNVIISFIMSEFERRRNERKPYDLAWELNINFLIGNHPSNFLLKKSNHLL